MTTNDVSELFHYAVVRDRPLASPMRSRDLGRLEPKPGAAPTVALLTHLTTYQGDRAKQVASAKKTLEAELPSYGQVAAHARPRLLALRTGLPLEVAVFKSVFAGGPLAGGSLGGLLQSVVLAWTLAPPPRPDAVVEAIEFLKAWYYGETNEVLLERGLLSDFWHRLPLFLPSVLAETGADKKASGKGPIVGSETDFQEPDRRLADARVALRDLEAVASELERGILSGTLLKQDGKQPAPPKLRPAKGRPSRRAAGSLTTRLVLDSQRLTKPAREALRDLAGSEAPTPEAALASVVDELRRKASAYATALRERNSSVIVANMLVGVRGGGTPNSNAPPPPAAPAAPPDDASRMRFYAGVADLKLVKERLIAYELADFAHIENVLAGEEKERVHRRLETTEVETLSIVETEEETERDNQSTSRNEIATEASTTAKETVKVEGGLSVSGSYGPTVEFTANAAAGYTNDTTSTQKRSSSFAKEVVQRTVEKVRSRVLNQRRVKTLNEVEETNTHALKNAAPGAEHIRGVYRWLNKICEAQIYDYGARHMFQFVVPEPAAFFLYAAAQNSDVLHEPTPPNFTAAGIKRGNYQALAALYNAKGVEGPPDWFIDVGTIFKKQPDSAAADDKPKVIYAHDAVKVQVPDGYAALGARVQAEWIYDDDGGIEVTVGGLWLSAPFDQNFGRRMRKDVVVGMQAYAVYDYYCTVDLYCLQEPNSQKFETWQAKTFDAIMEGYARQRAEYEEKLAAAATRQGIVVSGNNPLMNRQIVANELKRNCLSLFFGVNVPGFDLFQSNDPTSPQYAMLNVQVARLFGLPITFYERAFEWENMTYQMMPYFWGRNAEWTRRVVALGDADPDFAAFLRAGAARVLVPARPEFAEALLGLALTGRFPDGTDQLLNADDALKAMIEEVRARAVEPAATKDGEPWETRVPTSLVLLQDAGELSLRDVLTETP